MRINLYSGPNGGKSTAAAYLFSQLKIRGYSIELVPEWVKTWAYQGKKLDKFDQYYLWGKQHQYEYRYLSCGVKNIVSDSPVLLPAIYSLYNGNTKMCRHIEELCDMYEEDYPSFNILLERVDNTYQQMGRYQDEDEARKIDRCIKAFLGAKPNFREKMMEFRYDDYDEILREVEKRIDK